MTVAAILRDKGSDIISASPDASLLDVSNILGEKRIGAVMVLDESGDVAGIISERDVVRAISREGANALGQPVSVFMTREVVSCTGEDTIQVVMEKMTAGRFRHVPVIERGKLVGLISIGDVVKERIAQAEADAEQMRSYISMA